MVHNGIEYGIMAAYAEGLNILRTRRRRHADARRTTPRPRRCATREYYQYEIDTPEVAEVWRRGSVVGSWLLDLTADALLAGPDLDDFDGRVSDSGEGRWTALAAIDEGVPAPVLTAALFERFSRAARPTSPTGAVGDAQGVRRARREDHRLEICRRTDRAVLFGCLQGV